MWLQIPAWVTLSKSRDLWGSNCLSIKWGTIKESVWQLPSPPGITYFAMYNEDLFAQVSRGKIRMCIIRGRSEYIPWA